MKRISPLFSVLLFIFAASSANAGWFSWWGGDTKDEYTKTKYPIVLVHGALGFDDILGFEYFYRIPYELERSGATVFVPSLSALHSNAVRGEQLARQVEEYLAISGADKVHLIGHSHGGPAVQYIANAYPEIVASATTVGGVLWGTFLGDVVTAVIDTFPITATITAPIFSALSELITLLSGNSAQSNNLAAIEALGNRASIEAFNQAYPEGIPSSYCGEGAHVGSNGQRLYSWSGGASYTNPFDITDPFQGAIGLSIFASNDGFVPSCATHYGKVLRDDYFMNHLDEVNQFVGLHGFWGTDPVTVYRQHANRLKNLGL